MIETYRGVVHPWLCDVMGHLTTRHYTAMFDDASYHLAHACGLTPSAETGFVDVQLTMKFVTELRVGSLFYIRSGFSKVGVKSFSAQHQMYNCADECLAATQESVSVSFDLITRKAVPLTEEFRSKAALLMINETC